ncbi:MAG: hypothetical protein O2894_08775 [Planctomycetota bacterium]|nr:hypothetical protein [Planctomycetota bacterium]
MPTHHVARFARTRGATLLLAAGVLLTAVCSQPGGARAEDAPPADAPMARLAFFVGTFVGQGSHPAGAYDANPCRPG